MSSHISNITLTEEQLEATKIAKKAIAQKQDCVIHGLAGTGKSVTLSYLANELGCKVVAPTGKAALVVTKKIEREATTIHRLFYKLIGDAYDPLTKRQQPIFDFEPQIGKGDVVLMDECSMVGIDTRDKIRSTGAITIAFGDHGQLQPVNDTGGYLDADYVLQKIHRQAAESPIIQQAYQVREGRRYHDLGIEGFSVKSDIDENDLLNADIVLCWKNKTVADYNEAIREFKGFSGQYAQPGEPVMCLRNWNQYGIMNGGIYPCTEPYNPSKRTIGVLVNNRSVIIPSCGWRTNTFDEKTKTAMDWSYAATVHKSQGSEWDNVLLMDEFKGAERSKWLYTGFTRAAKNLMVCPAY